MVERVRQDLLRSTRLGVGEDDLIERPLHVEHHGVEAPSSGAARVLALARRVVEIAETERLGEPARGIDREYDGCPAEVGGAHRECRRKRRLAYTARPAAHDDSGGRVTDESIHIQPAW